MELALGDPIAARFFAPTPPLFFLGRWSISWRRERITFLKFARYSEGSYHRARG